MLELVIPANPELGGVIPLSTDNEVEPIVVTPPKDGGYDPNDPIWGGGNGGGGGGSGGSGGAASSIPSGFKPVGDGTKYMQDALGRYHFTPAYQQQVQNINIDWAGVIRDLAWIAGTSIGGVAANAYGIAGGMLATGIDTWKQMNPQPNP